MKKFLWMMAFFCCFALFPRISLAGDVPSWVDSDCYYQGDRNYVLVQGFRGMDIYVDVSSIVSKLYRPPGYEISAVVMIVDPSSDTQRFITHTWHYYYDVQYERRRMYVWDEQQHDWNYIPKFMENGECSANTVLVRPGGEFVWWRCYRMNFYHK